MVFSVRANKTRILAVLIVLAVVVCGVIFIPKMVAAPMKHYGETPSQRTEFLASYGWTISAEPIDSREVTIPKEFSEVYTKYNVMQQAQGFDLKPFAGQTCRQYIYLVENYPETGREIHATLLVYEGVIIGGDISCAEADGFMHGFAVDSARYGEIQETAKPAETPAATEAPAATAQPQEDAAKAKQTDAEPEAQVLDEETGAPAEDAGEPVAEAEDTAADAGTVDEAEIYPTD